MYKTSDHPPQLDDVCDASHGERTEHFLTNMAEKNSPHRVTLVNVAKDMATSEMLDEIHCMLRYLCFDKNNK